MTLDELEADLPNGLHDALLRTFSSDVPERRAEFILDVWLGDLGSSVTAERERYREFKAQIDLINRRIARLRPRALSITNVPGPPAGPDIAPVHVLRSGDYRHHGPRHQLGTGRPLDGADRRPRAIAVDGV